MVNFILARKKSTEKKCKGMRNTKFRIVLTSEGGNIGWYHKVIDNVLFLKLRRHTSI